jgi:hypothetical protein
MISERAIGQDLPVRLEELVKAHLIEFLKRPVNFGPDWPALPIGE